MGKMFVIQDRSWRNVRIPSFSLRYSFRVFSSMTIARLFNYMYGCTTHDGRLRRPMSTVSYSICPLYQYILYIVWAVSFCAEKKRFGLQERVCRTTRPSEAPLSKTETRNDFNKPFWTYYVKRMCTNVRASFFTP